MVGIKLAELLERIYCADEEEINPIINAVTERFSEIWPEWELLTLSIHGNDRESHIRALQGSLALLNKIKENDLP